MRFFDGILNVLCCAPHYICLLLISLVNTSCANEAPPLVTTYYHWQTRLQPDSTAKVLLTGSDRLYLKAFDVVWEGGVAAPTAEAIVADTVDVPTLVPVIFLTNEVLQNIPAIDIPKLAEDVSTLIRKLLPATYPEIQLDCDWTARTQVQYFDFLRAMKVANPERKITCTIRLHQYRDRDAQGVPPVERATLMAYNTGDLSQWETENSIIDSIALGYYLMEQPPYPIPLDIAVAVYDWAVIYRRGKLVQLINEPDLEVLADTTRLNRLELNRYSVKSATYIDGVYLYEDDLLRYEKAPPARVNAEGAYIRELVGGFPGQRLIIYRLGSRLWR